MTAPSPLIMETLAAHALITGIRDLRKHCSCGWMSEERLTIVAGTEAHREHVAQALADAGVLGPEQVREREAAALHALADKWQCGVWAKAPRRADPVRERLANALFVTDWLRAQANTRGPR